MGFQLWSWRQHERFSVRGIGGVVVEAGAAGQTSQTGTIRIHGGDFQTAPAVRGEGDGTAVGRPAWMRVMAGILRQSDQVGAV